MTKIKDRVLDIFTHLHNNPEISWEEWKTTSYVERILRENNCTVQTFPDTTGIIGDYGNFDNDLPIVAIRADMDALWQEVDGKFQANHSCGHDGHMSMVLGLLFKLEENPQLREKVAIRFLFQPAEEVLTGALEMVKQGAVKDVDYLYGIHLRPKEEIAMGDASPVIVHGATKWISAKIEGEDAHGGRPHLNKNAVEVGMQIVSMMNQIHLDPRVPYSVKMTQFNTGGKNKNIIPGNADFALDLRADNNQLMKKLEKEVFHILESIQSLYDINVKITGNSGVPAAEINDDAIQMMGKAITATLGSEKLAPPLMTPGGDDFHFYTIEKPTLKATMVGLGCDLEPGLHHPNMTFNRDALMDGVNVLHEVVLQTYGISDK